MNRTLRHPMRAVKEKTKPSWGARLRFAILLGALVAAARFLTYRMRRRLAV